MTTATTNGQFAEGKKIAGPTDNLVVETTGLKKHFPIKNGMLARISGHVQAVDGVDLRIGQGECVGLVGESGSGKSTTGRLIMRLIEPSAGQVVFNGTDITHLGQGQVRPLRRDMSMVFQDPYSSMAPLATVAESISEPLKTHTTLKGSAMDARVDELLRTVRLSPSYRSRYPNEFSGGQLQRIAVARALATSPRLVVLDEPVSSLDVSTKADVINLLVDLQRELGISYLFIAHDLAVVRHISNRIAVMYLGRIVEQGDAEEVYTNPQHPYTKSLLSAIPIPDPAVQRKRERIVLEGDLPSPANPPSGCRFHTRCPVVMDVCRQIDPPLSVTEKGTAVYCHLVSGTPSTKVSIGSNGHSA
ncbi:MAG: ABC transporter ATP-binding protein [Acidimicrobiia bacterium]